MVRESATGFLSDGILYIFNPEHDLCLANGDRNFVPPASALTFSRECARVSGLMGRTSSGHFCDVGELGTGDIVKICPWGWDPVLRRRLSMLGVPDSILPSADFMEAVRELSHRRLALIANLFITRYVHEASEELAGLVLAPGSSQELHEFQEVKAFVSDCGNAVAKAPWSGSGHGLRWLRDGEISAHDEGWCRNVILRQGSVIIEKRMSVIQDFAMLFNIGEDDDVSFGGYSMFFCDNGTYSGNVLGSDRLIHDKICEYLPEVLILLTRSAMEEFLRKNFAGRYSGPVGVDMFVYREGCRYCLAPCVEINLRMTMGFVARHLYDIHIDGIRWNCDRPDSDIDGKYVMKVLYNNDCQTLEAALHEASAVPFRVPDGAHYAMAVFPK